MKTGPKECLVISAALLAIFLSGYGVGHLLASKKISEDRQPCHFTIPTDRQTGPWKESMMEQLSSSLNLNKNQKKLIADEIQQSSIQMSQAYEDSARLMSREQLKLFQNISPHLTSEQAETLNFYRKAMEEKINSRFQ